MSAVSCLILGQMTRGSSGEQHLDFKPVDTSKTEDALRAVETACQLAIQQIPQEVEVSQELLRYPEGEAGAVTLTERDMQELEPGKFLGYNIVDFYIRFLERRLPPEHGMLFYFFNSFFFTKLLQSTTPTRIDPCKVDYEQLRRWTEEVNLFEKDYVFIPILRSSHWSLVIICHLSSLTRAPDEMTRFPCIVHLDPIEGQHESFEGLIRSYVLQAWMERFQASIDRDQLLALYQMKYVAAQVPRHDNFHDCGLYVLHYIEAFLVESTSPDFSFTSSERGPHFSRPHFAAEVLSKRKHIQNLIVELSGISHERARKCRVRMNLVQELLQTSQKLRAFLQDEGYSEACIKDVLPAGPTISSGEGCEITHASNHEDPMDVQHQQSTQVSRGNNEPLRGLQIGLAEYENKSGRSSPKHQHAKPEMHTVGLTSFNGQISETEYGSTHEDSMDVQHQQSSGISRLVDEPVEGSEIQHVEFQRVPESFSQKLQHPELEEIPCMDSSEAMRGTNKRGKNMTEEETSVLLLCKVEGGRFCKGRGGGTYWNLISEEIGKKLGSLPSADQCRLRYDTLKKAYKTYKKYFMQTGKAFSAITKEERLDWKFATTLSEEWYTTMDEIFEKANISQKRMKLSPTALNDLHPLSSLDSPAPNPPPISRVVLDSACGIVAVAFRNVFPASVFNFFTEDLQSILLNLVQECSWTWRERNRDFNLEKVCRRLAVLQDREPREILTYVLKLWELGLVGVVGMDFVKGNDLANIDLWEGKTWFLKFGVYEKISKEVLCKNPHLKTYCNSFPIERSSLQYIRVLSLCGRDELEHLDLREFPSLWSLAIICCPNFNSVTGWEVATGLGSLEISYCNAYRDFPEVRYLSSLRDISVRGQEFNESPIPWQLSQLSQCAKLRRLEIWGDASLSELADLKTLTKSKYLEYLLLGRRPFFSFSGLQALTTLHLQYCKSLRRVPELGLLKGLTHLNMSFSSVEDVVGVEELHLLMSVDLCGCRSLEWLPFLGHLKALVYLDLRGTCVKEIPIREDLISLKTLYWDK